MSFFSLHLLIINKMWRCISALFLPGRLPLWQSLQDHPFGTPWLSRHCLDRISFIIIYTWGRSYSQRWAGGLFVLFNGVKVTESWGNPLPLANLRSSTASKYTLIYWIQYIQAHNVSTLHHSDITRRSKTELCNKIIDISMSRIVNCGLK